MGLVVGESLIEYEEGNPEAAPFPKTGAPPSLSSSDDVSGLRKGVLDAEWAVGAPAEGGGISSWSEPFFLVVVAFRVVELQLVIRIEHQRRLEPGAGLALESMDSLRSASLEEVSDLLDADLSSSEAERDQKRTLSATVTGVDASPLPNGFFASWASSQRIGLWKVKGDSSLLIELQRSLERFALSVAEALHLGCRPVAEKLARHPRADLAPSDGVGDLERTLGASPTTSPCAHRRPATRAGPELVAIVLLASFWRRPGHGLTNLRTDLDLYDLLHQILREALDVLHEIFAGSTALGHGGEARLPFTCQTW